MKPIPIIVGSVVALVILLWGVTIFIISRPEPGTGAPGKGSADALATAPAPAQARASSSAADQQKVSAAPAPIAVVQESGPRSNVPIAAQEPNPSTLAEHLQGLTPAQRQQKEAARQEQQRRQAEQDAKAEAFIRQDKGGEQFAQHVAPRAMTAPGGSTQ